MKNIKVIYWSGTGNTEEMAQEVARGIEAANGQAQLLEVAEVTPDSVKEDTVFALGCPAMRAPDAEAKEACIKLGKKLME